MKFYDQPDGASQTKVLTRARMETHPHEFEPAELLDAFGERALQVYLERCYSVYLTNCSSLIQQRSTFPSPLLYGPDGQKRKPLDCSFDDLEAT